MNHLTFSISNRAIIPRCSFNKSISSIFHKLWTKSAISSKSSKTVRKKAWIFIVFFSKLSISRSLSISESLILINSIKIVYKAIFFPFRIRNIISASISSVINPSISSIVPWGMASNQDDKTNLKLKKIITKCKKKTRYSEEGHVLGGGFLYFKKLFPLFINCEFSHTCPHYAPLALLYCARIGPSAALGCWQKRRWPLF